MPPCRLYPYTLLPQVVARVDQGLPDRGPDPAVAAEMKTRGTSSLEAFKLQKASFDGFYSAYFTDTPRYIRMAEQAVEKDPGWAHAWASLAMLQGQFNDAAKATLAKAAKSIDRSRDAAGVAVVESLVRFAERNAQEAAALLSPVHRADPTDDLVAQALSSELLQAHDLASALSVVMLLHEARPDLQFGEDAAEYLRYAGRKGETGKLLETWAERAPESEQAFLSLAAHDLDSGKIAEAEELAKRTLLVHGQATFRLAPVIDVLLIADKPVEAKRLAERMLGGNEFDRARGYKRLAVASVLEGRFGGAYENLQAGYALARTQGTEGEAFPMMELTVAVAPLVAPKSEVIKAYDILAQAPSKVEAAGFAYQAALLRLNAGECIDPWPRLTLLPEGVARTSARRLMLRAAVDHGCAACADVIRAGLSTDESFGPSIFRFATCAEKEGALTLAKTTFERVSKLHGSNSFFHSILARFHLGRVLFALGEKDAGRAQLKDFLAHWEKADHPLPEIEEARKLLAAP